MCREHHEHGAQDSTRDVIFALQELSPATEESLARLGHPHFRDLALSEPAPRLEPTRVGHKRELSGERSLATAQFYVGTPKSYFATIL